MKTIFTTPPLTVLGSLASIAKNVGSTSLKPAPALSDGAVEIERIGEEINWRQGRDALVFSTASVTVLELLSLQNAGNRFLAAAITWKSGDESLCYRVITSHESEAQWLKAVLRDISRVLDRPITERNLGVVT